jgi:ABC-type glycerol-3-phosphate transport system substrate-binding protein
MGAAMLLFVLGCAKKTESGGAAAKAVEAVDFSEHETFTAWLFADDNEYIQDYSDNPVVWALNKKFNITLKFEQPVRGTETEALSLMFGTGEYTDMIEMSRYNGSVAQLYEDGVIVDIAEYLDYMPNLRRFLETDSGYRKFMYNDDGRILKLWGIGDPELYEFDYWGGLVYRRDILETITNKNIQFPSGGEEPKTIDDWEYMLPLFKAYFEAAGMADYAPLILPYQGFFAFGELTTSFGSLPTFLYLDGNTVKSGLTDDAFYKYLKKMREWYEKGWIYKDFASRVNDVFYLPNPALTYGGAAGVWWGLVSQLGGGMSRPEYGLVFDVRALSSPLSVQDGISEFTNALTAPSYESQLGWSFSTKCKNLPKLLTVLDYLYSEEGGLIYSGGLTKETGSHENPILASAGLQDGHYWYEGDTLVVNPALRQLDRNYFLGQRLPGRVYTHLNFADVLVEKRAQGRIWDPYPNAKMKRIPGGISFTVEEEKTVGANSVRIDDYVYSTVPKFIMGTQPLNDRTWAEFKAQLQAYGNDENLRINQAAYERYLKRE